MTAEQHNRYVGFALLAHAAFQLLMLGMVGLIFFFMMSIPDRPGQPGPPPEFFGLIFGFMLVFQLMFVIPSFVAAYAVFTRKSWARIAAIIAGVLGAMNMPIGTAACAYSMWFFMSENWKPVYGIESAGQTFPPQMIAQGPETRWTGYQTNEKGEVSYQPFEPPDWR